MAFAVACKRAPLAVASLLKKLLLAAPSASASGATPAAAALCPAPACVVAARRLFSTGGAPFRRDDFDSSEEYSGDEDAVYDRLRSRGFSVSMFSSAGRSVPPFPPPSTPLLSSSVPTSPFMHGSSTSSSFSCFDDMVANSNSASC